MVLLPQKDLHYWAREFEHLLSGWTIEQQIQFHSYMIRLLEEKQKGRQKED